MIVKLKKKFDSLKLIPDIVDLKTCSQQGLKWVNGTFSKH